MAAAPVTMTVAPLEEKVAVLEDAVEGPRDSQYALKFVGAAISSKYGQPYRCEQADRCLRTDMVSSAICNPTDM